MKRKLGFTLAEVLLTLAVIGIVAAITLPSLLVDTAEKAFDAQRRALHARLAQAIGMMSTLSGYGQYQAESKEGAGDGKDNAAETFLYEGLSKVYKMNNICDSDNLDKCGIPSTITRLDGKPFSSTGANSGDGKFPTKLSELNSSLIKDMIDSDSQNSDLQTTDTKAAAFETVNGESVAVFYNPNCKNNLESGTNANPDEPDWGNWFFIQNRMCVNFVYDLNGAKGPNKVGRDIGFITALYAKNPEVVAPMPFEADIEGRYSQKDAVALCANYSDDARLPNVHEGSSLFYNKFLIGNLATSAGHYWSSSMPSSGEAWYTLVTTGVRGRRTNVSTMRVRCIKK